MFGKWVVEVDPKEAITVAYPEPIPPLTGEAAREFLRRLKNFKLTAEQKELYRNARANYRAAAPKEERNQPE